MIIEQIRIYRQLVEAQILLALAQFKDATGLAIVGCDVRTVQLQRLDQATPETHHRGVSLTVESI